MYGPEDKKILLFHTVRYSKIHADREWKLKANTVVKFQGQRFIFGRVVCFLIVKAFNIPHNLKTNRLTLNEQRLVTNS